MATNLANTVGVGEPHILLKPAPAAFEVKINIPKVKVEKKTKKCVEPHQIKKKKKGGFGVVDPNPGHISPFSTPCPNVRRSLPIAPVALVTKSSRGHLLYFSDVLVFVAVYSFHFRILGKLS